MGDKSKALEPADPLDSREEAFAQEWVYGRHAGVGNRCAELAGYAGSPDILSHRAWELRRRPRVAAAIKQMVEEKNNLLKGQFHRAVDELFGVAVANVAECFDVDGNLLPLDQIPLDLQRAIKSIKTNELWEGSGEDRRQIGVTREVVLHDKRGAIETFLKFSDKLSDKVKLEAGEKLASLFLEAQRLRESRKKAT